VGGWGGGGGGVGGVGWGGNKACLVFAKKGSRYTKLWSAICGVTVETAWITLRQGIEISGMSRIRSKLSRTKRRKRV